MEYSPLGLPLQVEGLLGECVHQSASAYSLNVIIRQVQCNDLVALNEKKAKFGLPFSLLPDCQTIFRLLFSGPSRIDLREVFENFCETFFTLSEFVYTQHNTL